MRRTLANQTSGPSGLADYWRVGIVASWFLFAVLMLIVRAPDIAALTLVDTDDNLRLAQVRALLDGQGWYDLRQYRLAAPIGADIHWSRLPDLPIAGLILLMRPFLGAAAENWAVAIAPLLPLGLGLAALSLIVRRLVDPRAWPIAVLLTPCALGLLSMWAPLRIDHHGWQLALLALAIAGLVDANKRRGGMTSGIATALSFAIGLEMLLYLAMIGAIAALFWIRDRGEAPRLAAYGAVLGGGTALGFALFASEANRAPVCDALSPVWLSVLAIAGAALVLVALLSPAGWRARLGLAAIAGAILIAGFALVWPDCLSRPEGTSSELAAVWLDNVREARPLHVQDWRAVLALLAMPLSGAVGYTLALRRSRGSDDFYRWLAVAALALASFALLFWQMRLGPGMQMLFIPGAVALAWHWIRKIRASPSAAVRIFGTVGALILITGIYMALPIAAFPKAEDAVAEAREEIADQCPTAEALAPVAARPPATIFTPIDLGPRLIVMTPHSAVAGPYHRNEAAILDVFHAFQRPPDQARAIIARRTADYVMICQGISGERHFGAEDEASLMHALIAGEAPGWLEPVTLPEGSPFRLWRVR
ncbi:MAG: AcrB/AcrD/AcrF family protein [Sphingomonadaceae bacterium]|nr:AcrB/AcrD/AcrF family protein [Sphingomonadaceae bacterium]